MSHPHVLKVFDYGEHSDMVYIVMEMLTGGGLNDLIRSQGALQLPVMTRIVNQVPRRWTMRTSASIVHRDMKPQNVLLDENGNLTDFGIAKLLTETCSHAERHGHGHARLHGSGAVARRTGGRPHRHVRSGRHAL